MRFTSRFPFFRVSAAPPPPEPNPPRSVVASEQSITGTRGIFEKYNPDELIRTKGFAIYRRMMLDEQLKAVVRFKIGAITSRRYHFEVPEEYVDELGEDEAKHRVGMMTHLCRNMHCSFRDGLNAIMSAQWTGFSVTEKVMGFLPYEGKQWRALLSLRPKPFDTFTFEVDEAGNLQRLIQNWAGKAVEVNPARVVHYVVNPELDEHYGSSNIREAYRSWFCKDTIIKFQSIFLERAAAGFNVATQLPGTVLGSQDRAQLEEILTSLTSLSSVLLPPGVALEVNGPSDTQAFDRALIFHDLQMAKALLVPNLLGLTHTGQTGAYSQSQTQFEAFLWTLDNDATRLVDCLNQQVFREVGEANFGDDMWPRWCLDQMSEMQKAALLDVWARLVQAKATVATDTDDAHIREMLGFPEAGEKLIEEPVALPGALGGQPGGEGSSQPKQTTAAKPKSAAYSRAERRVAAPVLKRSLDVLNEAGVAELSSSLARLTDGLLVRLKDGLDSRDLERLAAKSGDVREVQAAVIHSLKGAWKLGQRHARDELERARKSRFKRWDAARLEDLAADFFRSRSFTVAGKATGDVVAVVRESIENGLKYSWTPEETTKRAYLQLGSKGLLSKGSVKAALGSGTEALDTVEDASRLRTIVTTLNSEAMNEARYGMFTDPELGDFVTGFEYSAILDDNTTEFCAYMNGKMYAADSVVWQEFRPPNHFNCRSLLVPLTAEDWDGEEDEVPKQQPQEGFGGV